MNPSTPKPDSSSGWRSIIGLGVEIVGIFLLWVGLGYLADKYGGLSPYGMLIGGLVGVGHILWRLIQVK
ncbi:MAG: hypothetical protein ABDH66_01090 [Bacteroidia bacterium]